jgi:thiol-disulfide isomerase/thioredoxin
LLIKEIAEQYPSQVNFVSENWGESKLAKYYGITRYPVVFVDDILIAQPDDFGWLGAKGKYTPWRDPANHTKFKRDLSKMIDLLLRGQKTAAGKPEVRIPDAGPTTLPQLAAEDIDGRRVDFTALQGKVVLVEFWATWCAPCRTTLAWFGELKERYGDRLELIAVSVESPEKEVRALAATLHPAVRLLPVSEELIRQFGDVTSVPTLYLFDKTGKTANIFFGAPQDLHQKITRLIDAALQ